MAEDDRTRDDKTEDDKIEDDRTKDHKMEDDETEDGKPKETRLVSQSDENAHAGKKKTGTSVKGRIDLVIPLSSYGL